MSETEPNSRELAGEQSPVEEIQNQTRKITADIIQ